MSEAERCFICEREGFFCQRPSVGDLHGRVEAFFDGKRARLIKSKTPDDEEDINNCGSRNKVLEEKKVLAEAQELIEDNTAVAISSAI